MAGTQGLANYCPDQRYYNWQWGFDRGCNSDLLESLNLDSHDSKDPNDIYLADVIYQLKTWEKKLEIYGSIHKTDLFHDFQDAKYKLLVKLDDIEISRNPERREKRLKIYDRVNNLAKKLDDKIHSNHPACQDCVQVKILAEVLTMATEFNTEGAYENLQCNLIVKVSGNSLYLNPDVLRRIVGLGQENIPVVVVSVVGQPKSRKTSVMNSVLKHFREVSSNPINLFPLSDDDPTYSDLKCQEGVLLWQCPQLVISKDGKPSAWFFMDIWMEYPRLTVYKKLVDFCLSTSSAVIFSEPCSPNPEIYWQPCDSTLQSKTPEFCNALQLHLLLQTDESLAFINKIFEGPPNLTLCTAELSKKLTSVIDATTFLTARSKCITITSTFIRSDDNEEESKSSNLVKCETLKNFLNQCLCNPLEINNEVVHLVNLSFWFQESISLINGNTNTSESNENNISGILKNEITIAPCLPNKPSLTLNCEQGSGSEQVINEAYNLILTDDDIEMLETWEKQEPARPHVKEDIFSSELVSNECTSRKEAQEFTTTLSEWSEGETFYKALTKSKVPLACQPDDEIKKNNMLLEISRQYITSFIKIFEDLEETQGYFEDVDLLNRHKDISEGIIQKFGIQECSIISQLQAKLSEDFRYVQNDNNIRKSTFVSLTKRMNSKLNDLLEEIEKQLQQQLSKNACRFTSNFSKQFQTVCDKLVHDFPASWKKQILGIVESSRTNLQQILNSMNALVYTYNQNFEILYEDKICFEPNQFESFHQENLKKTKSSTNYVESGRKTLDNLCAQVIENCKRNFQERNSTVYYHEERIAKDAHDHAIEKYKGFMDQKISSTTLTESELQCLHRRASERILSLFASNFPVPHTQPWINQHLRLEQSLASLLIKHKQQNQNHLKKVTLAKKEGFNAGKMRYQEVMERSLPVTKVSDGILSDYDGKALHQAISRLKEKIAHIHQEISTHWEEEFKATLLVLKQQYINDNESKKDKPISYSAAVRQDAEIVHQPPVGHTMNKPYGIGLYVSLNKICVGVYVNQSVNFNENVTSYEPPLIAFTAGRVSIGQDAEKDFNAASNSNAQVYLYKIFSLLQDHNDFEIDVSINGVRKTLGREEILSIFFHRLRINTEGILNQRVNSCYVVATGLLTGGAKQMLKTSLKIAGFQEANFIPCTTAMAISHILRKDSADSGYKNANIIVVAYATSSSVEVASVDIVSRKVFMKTLSGETNFKRSFQGSTLEQMKNATIGQVKKYFSDETEFEKRIKHVLNLAVSSKDSYERVVLYYENDINSPNGKALCSQLKSFCRLKSISKSDLIDDIVRVAAALDAKRNQHPDLLSSKLQFPTYNNISPYKVTANIYKKSKVFVDFNSGTTVSKTIPLNSSGYADITIILQEEGRDSQNTWIAAEYKFEIPAKPDIKFVLSLNDEANLTVSTMPKGCLVKTNAKSLVASECQRILESLKPLLHAQENIHGIKLQGVLTLPEQASQVTVMENKSAKEDLLRNVKILVEQVRIKLERSQTTSNGVKENIMDKIRKCEELTSSTDLKIKQLELVMKNLERAAKLIKS